METNKSIDNLKPTGEYNKVSLYNAVKSGYVTLTPINNHEEVDCIHYDRKKRYRDIYTYGVYLFNVSLGTILRIEHVPKLGMTPYHYYEHSLNAYDIDKVLLSVDTKVLKAFHKKENIPFKKESIRVSSLLSYINKLQSKKDKGCQR